MTAPRGESELEGRYLKVKVLDFLDRRLGTDGPITWRQLAGQLDFTSMDVDKLEADGFKIDQSSTKLLLRKWENGKGGCNVELLMDSLLKIGRQDIVTDLMDEYEKQGIELVEPRSRPTTIRQIPQDGQDERFAGTELVESRSGPTTIGQIPLGDGEVLLIGKSDPEPVIRKDLSTSGDQSWGSGTIDRIPRSSNSPKNLMKLTSSQLSEEPLHIRHTIFPSIPPEISKDERSYLKHGDFGSLRSEPRSIRDSSEHGGAWAGKQYLVLSSDDEQDRVWSKKLCTVLNKKGHQAYWLHDVHPRRHRALFYQVQYVLVIYTEKYKKDFQTTGTRNQILFQEMQIEYQINNRVNHRFIPVYDVGMIRLLPDALLNGNAAERNYIMDLLSSKHPSEGMHSSAPSQGTRPGPVINREYHSPQTHAKRNNSEKKVPFWKQKFPSEVRSMHSSAPSQGAPTALPAPPITGNELHLSSLRLNSIPSTIAKSLKTEETTEPAKDDSPSASGQASSQTHGIDDIITKVADSISDDGDLRRLGLELGVQIPVINRALETNWAGGTKTSNGNVKMLQNWAETVESSKLIQTLRTALKRARLLEVEETCFTSSSRGTDVASKTIHPSRGGTIELPHHGINLCIPALALQKECEITLKVLPHPSSVLFADNEAIVSPGIVCEPSGTTFALPLKLVIPHCAVLTDPSKAKVTMHFTHGNAKVTKKELSSTGSPRCIVRANDLEVYITHFSIYEMFMAISDYLIGKRVASTPYLPKLMSRLQPQYCHLRLFNDTPGLADLIEKEEEKLDYRKMAPTKKMFVHLDKGELKIICEVKGGYVPENERMKTVSLDDIYRLDQNLFSFSVRATGDADIDFKFNFYPHCDEGQAFIAKFSGITETTQGNTDSPRPSASKPVDIPPQGASATVCEASPSKARLDLFLNRSYAFGLFLIKISLMG